MAGVDGATTVEMAAGAGSVGRTAIAFVVNMEAVGARRQPAHLSHRKQHENGRLANYSPTGSSCSSSGSSAAARRALARFLS